MNDLHYNTRILSVKVIYLLTIWTKNNVGTGKTVKLISGE